ncbi:hypothetical protein CNR22_11345 [Sphingobacteriaceae bacterium]|nr:hypothetical protein CNR22_11345 [Sphingobacteriaceae bacterium]
MKKTSTLFCLITLATINSSYLSAQCGSPVTLGTSSNMLTKAQFNGNTVVADKNLNTVIFIHRNNPTNFGGSSGNLRYDISTDAGVTWTNNVGTLNPNLTKQARYPNIALHNPANNTDPNNAYLTFMAPTLSNAGAWSGLVTGGQKLNGSGNTEAYIQPATTNYISGSLIKGAPGVFWATDFSYNGTQFTGNIFVYKGLWNSTSNSISWSLNKTFSPSFNLSYSGNPPLGECNIAFDPTGMIGWVCVTTHPNSSSGAYRYQPMFYKTVDGGLTWSSGMVVDLAQFSCITGGLGANTVPGVYYANDLTVDVYGHPHMILTVGASDNTYGISSNQWHHILDVTQQHGVWTAYDVANVMAEVATIFPGSLGSNMNQIMHPQISRSSDGTKVFFSWTDNINYPLGFANMFPELYAKGFDVVQNKWTAIKDFTDCSSTATGQIFFPHMAAEVLEPSSGNYKLAVVYAQFSGDPDDQGNFRFLDNATFSSTDFINSQVLLNPLTVSPVGTVAICSGNSATLQVSGNYQDIQWSNGYSGSTSYANSPAVYYVGVRQGCNVGWDSVVVKTLSLTLSSATLNACKGIAQTLSLTGTALGYTWTPGPLIGSSVTLTPVSNVIYTVTGVGINTCVVTKTVNVVANPLPTVNITSSQSVICEGEQVILEASGATSYSWNSGASTATVSVYPLSTNDYMVTGYSNVGCVDTFTFSQVVDACTGISKINNTSHQLQVYPNPSAGKITIHSTVAVRVSLSNELGQVLQIVELTAESNQTVILRNLAPGIYFLSDGSQLHHKIVVQN